MHAAASTLVIHNVEFLVQEGVKPYLPILQSGVKTVQHLLIHVFEHALV